MLGENSGIAALDFGNFDSLASVIFTFIHANGDISIGGLNKLNTQSVEQDWDIHGDWDKLQADLATGDFNADGFDDVIGTWNRPDSTIVIYIREIDRNSYSWVNASRVSVQDDGFPKVYERDENNLKGWIRMMPGQFDEVALGFERTGFTLSVSSALDSIIIHSTKELIIYGSISIISDDMNLDGREEIIFADRNQLFVIESDDNLNLDNVVESARTGCNSDKSSHRTIALTDIDLSGSDTLRMEFVTAGFYEILVYQNTRDADEYNIGGVQAGCRATSSRKSFDLPF